MSKIQSILSDPESMEQIGQLAKMFSGGQEQPAQPAQQEHQEQQMQQMQPPAGQPAAKQGGGIDMNAVMAIQGVLAKASQPDKNRDFLLALKPLLKEENQRKIDRVIAVFKLLNVIPALKESGILGGDLLGIL